MYFLLILFFSSLFGITFMIGRKIFMLQNGQLAYREEMAETTPILEEWKYITIRNAKKQGYALLVGTIRLYVRSSNLIKSQYQELLSKLQSRNTLSEDRKEISKFLKVISDYKRKIRTIKQKVREEEKGM